MNKKIKVILLVFLYIISILGAFLLGKYSNEIINSFSINEVSQETNEKKEKKLTVDKVRSIDFDMSYDDVVKTIGFELKINSSTNSGNLEAKTYEYYEDLDRLILVFIDSKLVSIECEVGELNKNKKITEEEYAQIKDGMTYDEVRHLLGYEGRMRAKHKKNNVSVNNVEIVTQYSFSNINLTFKNDVLTSKSYEYSGN